MRKYSRHIQTKSEIHQCGCGIRFLEIQAEIDMGYKRLQCPWCVKYKNGSPTPPLTHNGEPWGMLEENNEFVRISYF